jgi:uncharacterized membrane protein
MNRYQFLMLAFIYGAIAYGAHLERKENNNTYDADNYWQAGFIFCNTILCALLVASLFIFLGAI